ncbi:MAG TPA: hypothetical protein VGG20_04470 [Thermoanaerobaculia bacterium]|jgi:hypothetical protein
MVQVLRRSVALTALTAALVFAVPAPSHAAHLRGAAHAVPASASGLMAQAWSWLEGVLGVSAPRHSTGLPFSKDGITMPPIVNPPGTSGSGSMVDPDGKPR